jgi:hypothetical protein
MQKYRNFKDFLQLQTFCSFKKMRFFIKTNVFVVHFLENCNTFSVVPSIVKKHAVPLREKNKKFANDFTKLNHINYSHLIPLKHFPLGSN